MWLLLVVLCLSQGLGSAIPIAEEYNPERFMNISEKIVFHKYPSEEYEVMTEDGYFLSLNRIPHGRGGAGRSASRSPVLLMHSFSLDGGDWVDNLPNNSLAFILADAGYDVWIGNNRGNSWSRRHISLSVEQEKFWDFSFHEMAIYDIPAMVGFILTQTEQEKLFYVGHAQGSTVGFIAFSTFPHLAEKIKIFFALSPTYTFRHVKGPVLSLAFLPETVLKLAFGTKELVLVGRKERADIAEECSSILVAEACENVIFLTGGYNRKNLDLRRLDVYLSHFPDYTSVKNLLHLGQTAKTGELRQFDYGLRNREKYNQSSPPIYRLEKMSVPVAVWTGGQDWENPPEEMQRLLPRITNIIRREHFEEWSHFDSLWGKDAPERLYSQMLFLMQQHP